MMNINVRETKAGRNANGENMTIEAMQWKTTQLENCQLLEKYDTRRTKQRDYNTNCHR